MASTFYVTIWTARLSILFSIIRIDPDPHVRRRLTFVAGLFFGAILFFLAQLLWVCEPQKGWKEERSPQCALNKEVAICQVVCECFRRLFICMELSICILLFVLHRLRSVIPVPNISVPSPTSSITILLLLSLHISFSFYRFPPDP